MYNRAFFFGDSFTYGHGVENEQTWCYHLYNHLNANEFINLGVPGYSNESIFNSIVDTFDNIGENDIVFILLTKSDRFNYVEGSKFKNYIVKDATNSILDKYWFYFIYPYRKTILKDRDNKTGRFFLKVLPSTSFLINRHDYRRKFETIEQSTNGKIKDSHWSAKGHRDFANYIIKELLE